MRLIDDSDPPRVFVPSASGDRLVRRSLDELELSDAFLRWRRYRSAIDVALALIAIALIVALIFVARL